MNYKYLLNQLKYLKEHSENKDYWPNENISPPYTEDELTAFENHFGEQLPEDFRNYMLNVSKDIFVDFYPITVDDFLPVYNGKNIMKKLFDRELGELRTPIMKCRLCNGDFSKPCRMKEFGIPKDLTSWRYSGWRGQKMKCPKCQNEYTGGCKHCNIGLYGGDVRVGCGGCSNEDILIIKGPHKGTVWRLSDDGGSKYKSTFSEYIGSTFYDYNDSDSDDDNES